MIDKNQIKLPSITEAGQQALELLSEGSIEMSNLADFLGKDLVISAAILKYVNSPVHRRKVEISSVRTAVPLLGLKSCKMIVGVTILQSYKSAPSVLTEKIWSHCTSVATVARLLADKIYPQLSDEIETTALMHDMGMLVLASSFPDSYGNIIDDCIINDTSLTEAEENIYNISHDHVLKFLAPILRLPAVTTKIIYDFHSSEVLNKVRTVEHKHQVICHLAHHIVQKYENYVSGNKGLNEHLAHDLDGLAILLNLSDHQLNDLVEDSEMILDIL